MRMATGVIRAKKSLFIKRLNTNKIIATTPKIMISSRLNIFLNSVAKRGEDYRIRDTETKDSAENTKIASFFGYRLNLPHLSQNWCSWIPPSLDELKINVDASLDDDGGGIGGLIRDNSGSCISLFLQNVNKEEIFELELFAIEKGIQLASTLSARNIWVESDSKFAVDILNGSLAIPWRQTMRIRRIKFALCAFIHHKITHIWREANSAADYLSKRNCPMKGWNVPGSRSTYELSNIIEEDGEGSQYLRL
ncbi:uncharacterized protein LOC143876958 [Tasmannia lanceolata]|uniref:uncharacterized protein LOC143876958 n=1 Tax=Tasmannia lanceolata TaxID=3420 RepID=UPI0040642B61